MATFFKVVVLGDGGIGKTSICNYLTTGEFFGSYKLSIGADFFSKKLTVDGEEVTLQICDIGGQDQFAEISSIFTKGAHGAIVCYDTTRRDTLDSLERWINKLEDKDIPKVLVSTKNDIEELREVYDEEGIETAKKFNIPFYIPTTSLKGIGITETFQAISRLMLYEKKGLQMPKTEIVDVMHPPKPEVHVISGSQHLYAQPLGVGRMATSLEEEKKYSPPITPIFEAPAVSTTPEDIQPTSFIQDKINNKFKHTSIQPHVQSVDLQNIEPPTEPEKTTTQPISSITSPPPKTEEKSINPSSIEGKGHFSFLDRIREERKRKLEQNKG